MAKKKAATKVVASAPATVVIKYDLFDLPTAQHKAGLAGLILQIESMQARAKDEAALADIPVIEEASTTHATIRFTEQSVCALMDDVYHAAIVETSVKSKWPGEPPKREEPVEEKDEATGKVTRSKRFIYDVVQPTGHFLKQNYKDGDGIWLKLWRDMLWQIPRSKPTTRGPYNARAEGKSSGEGTAAWKDLLAAEKARAKNEFKTAEVSSALLLGAQAVNAEGVAFLGRVEQTLLLHFWTLTVLTFVPQQINNDGESEFVGFSLAIPEVTNLERFIKRFPKMLDDLDIAPRGYRPAQAVIDIPQQAALEFFESLAELVQVETQMRWEQLGVGSVEYLHLVKQGNNVKTMASGRISTDPMLLDAYRQHASPKHSPYSTSLFRSGLLLSLLQHAPWWANFSNMLQTRPWPFFVRGEKSLKVASFFASDAAKKFQQIDSAHAERLRIHQTKVKDMPNAAAESPPQAEIDVLIYRLVRKFVNVKGAARVGLDWDDLLKKKKVVDDKEQLDLPQAFIESRQKLAASEFLAMRSRRDQDFVDYFTMSICSVGQYLPQDDFATVAKALLTQPDNVKTLTLLALSASS